MRARDDGVRAWDNRGREREDGDGGGAGARGCLNRSTGGSRGCVREGAGEGEVGRRMRVAGGGGVTGSIVRASSGVIGPVDRRNVGGKWYGTDNGAEGGKDRSADLGHDCGVWGC